MMERFKIQDPSAGIYLHHTFKVHEADLHLRHGSEGNPFQCSRIWVRSLLHQRLACQNCSLIKSRTRYMLALSHAFFQLLQQFLLLYPYALALFSRYSFYLAAGCHRDGQEDLSKSPRSRKRSYSSGAKILMVDQLFHY